MSIYEDVAWTIRESMKGGGRSLNKQVQWCVTDDVFSRPQLLLQQRRRRLLLLYRSGWRIVERRRLDGLLDWPRRRGYRRPSSYWRRRGYWTMVLDAVTARAVAACYLPSSLRPRFNWMHLTRQITRRRANLPIDCYPPFLFAGHTLLTIYQHTTVCCPPPSGDMAGTCSDVRMQSYRDRYLRRTIQLHPCRRWS